ncbi:hypothetical protein DL93DRAFT_2070745 [Clavulina sp. PMI_390]|nr:hypothetical protein DL93DRAFT_2070745 [Clavulina sp. PMI_390]
MNSFPCERNSFPIIGAPGHSYVAPGTQGGEGELVSAHYWLTYLNLLMTRTKIDCGLDTCRISPNHPSWCQGEICQKRGSSLPICLQAMLTMLLTNPM